MLLDHQNIASGIEYTRKYVEALKKAIGRVELRGSNVVINGSFARKEASEESDLDYFILCPKNLSEKDSTRVASEVRRAVEKIINRLPTEKGPFGDVVKVGKLTRSIGGAEDTNKTITQRILFLTEGATIGPDDLFRQQREELIERYIEAKISDHQLALFFLNDVIRYYRTVCVDFENKTFEDGKEWGTRRIKLIFSRKLLYFGGVLMAAETAHRTAIEKREIFRDLMSLTPLERLAKVCGESAGKAVADYDLFSATMADREKRTRLKGISRDKNAHTDEFKRIKNLGHHFSLHLLSALTSTYPAGHPIHRALVL